MLGATYRVLLDLTLSLLEILHLQIEQWHCRWGRVSGGYLDIKTVAGRRPAGVLQECFIVHIVVFIERIGGLDVTVAGHFLCCWKVRKHQLYVSLALIISWLSKGYSGYTW